MTVRFLMVALVAALLSFTAYWYAYGRERDLFEGTGLERVDLAGYLNTKETNESESKRLADIMARRSAILSAALDGQLTLTPNGSGGSTVAGTFRSGTTDWITNRAYVHVKILEKRRCGEKLQNMFADIDWEKKCASDPSHTAMDVVAGQAYQCFVGNIAYGETARCNAETVLPFDPTRQTWGFFFSKVTGHPKDPLGIFD